MKKTCNVAAVEATTVPTLTAARAELFFAKDGEMLSGQVAPLQQSMLLDSVEVPTQHVLASYSKGRSQ